MGVSWITESLTTFPCSSCLTGLKPRIRPESAFLVVLWCTLFGCMSPIVGRAAANWWVSLLGWIASRKFCFWVFYFQNCEQECGQWQEERLL